MTEISNIDKQINAVRRELRKLEKIDLMSVESWHQAWDRHPDLHERECELFRQRGAAQRERDAKAAKLYAQQQRQRRPKSPKKCPTCGCHTIWEPKTSKAQPSSGFISDEAWSN